MKKLNYADPELKLVAIAIELNLAASSNIAELPALQ